MIEKIFGTGFAIGSSDADGGEIGLRSKDFAGVDDSVLKIDNLVGFDK